MNVTRRLAYTRNGRIFTLKHVGLVAALAALSIPVSPGLGQDSGTKACSPSSGYKGRVAKFQAMPLIKQLNKIEYNYGRRQTPGIGVKRIFGIIDGMMLPQLDYVLSDKGPLYRLKLTENVPGSTSVNFHYAYQVELLIDGEPIKLTKNGEDVAFGSCNGSAGGCLTQMRSYYLIDPQVFAKVVQLPKDAILPLRIHRGGSEYRPCRDFIAAAEFMLLRSAIGQGTN